MVVAHAQGHGQPNRGKVNMGEIGQDILGSLHFYMREYDRLVKENASLRAQVEGMKCCATCEKWNPGKSAVSIIRCNRRNARDKCKEWTQSDTKGAKDEN